MKRLDLCCIFKLLNGQVYCQKLLSNLNFLFPSRSTKQLLLVPFQFTNNSQNTPIIKKN